jgi:hypothetical protein
VWYPVRILPVEPLIIEIAEKDSSAIDKYCSATVLVNFRPRVERSGRYIVGRTIFCISYDDIPPFLLGAALNPIDIVAVEKNVD